VLLELRTSRVRLALLARDIKDERVVDSHRRVNLAGDLDQHLVYWQMDGLFAIGFDMVSVLAYLWSMFKRLVVDEKATLHMKGHLEGCVCR